MPFSLNLTHKEKIKAKHMNETITKAKQCLFAYPQKEGDTSTFKNREDRSGNSIRKSDSFFFLLPNLHPLTHLTIYLLSSQRSQLLTPTCSSAHLSRKPHPSQPWSSIKCVCASVSFVELSVWPDKATHPTEWLLYSFPRAA